MSEHVDNIKENKAQSQETAGLDMEMVGGSSLSFQDNRPEAMQRKSQQAAANEDPQVKQLQAAEAAANESPEVKQLKATAAAANASPQVKQLQATEESLNKSPRVQGKMPLFAEETPAVQRKGMAEAQPKRENKTGMPDDLKAGVENLSGMAMDDVKVHYNSSEPAQLQAHAYAQGTDIYIGPGQEQHLPHEAWHVVQQKQGRVQATKQLKGVGINNDTTLETEADVMGAKAMQMGGTDSASDEKPHADNSHRKLATPTVQRRIKAKAQALLFKQASYILENTTKEKIEKLEDRVTFNPKPANDNRTIAKLSQWHIEAKKMADNHRNALRFSAMHGVGNYLGDDLDGAPVLYSERYTELKTVLNANSTPVVGDRKNALIDTITKIGARQKAMEYNGNKLMIAKTLVEAETALKEWEEEYFGFDRDKTIKEASKRGKYWRSPRYGLGTMWHGLSDKIDNKVTHLSVYHNNIPATFTKYIVTAATVEDDSNRLANIVLNNGSGEGGIHLTAEYAPIGQLNPRVFGNPPDPQRHSKYILPAGVQYDDFVAPMNRAMAEVRGDVWKALKDKKDWRA